MHIMYVKSKHLFKHFSTQKRWLLTSEKKFADCTDVNNYTFIHKPVVGIHQIWKVHPALPAHLPLLQLPLVIALVERKNPFSHLDR